MKHTNSSKKRLRELPDDKDTLLKALDKFDRFHIYLAGIRENCLLLVSDVELPKEIEVDGQIFTILHYKPEDYLQEVIKKEEELFRQYKVYYFVKSYMRRILDTLAYAEVERMSLDNDTFDP